MYNYVVHGFVVASLTSDILLNLLCLLISCKTRTRQIETPEARARRRAKFAFGMTMPQVLANLRCPVVLPT
jgi:hypothetical protein